MSPWPSVDPMASSALRYSLLWALYFSPVAFGLPGPSIINRAEERVEVPQSFDESQELQQDVALKDRHALRARATAIVSPPWLIPSFSSCRVIENPIAKALVLL